MNWSLRIGRIAGIDVKVHLTFLLLLAWRGASAYATPQGSFEAVFDAIFLTVLIFGCVLLHEFGHALAAQHYGIQTADITLLPIGGVARLERMPEEPWQELVVALAGPLVNAVILLGLGIVLAASSPRIPFWAQLDESPRMMSIPIELFVVNTMLILFNMIPAFPLDGGRVLRALLAWRLGYARATRIAAGIGQVGAIGFGLLGLGLVPGLTTWNPLLMLIAVFLFIAGSREATAVQMRHLARNIRLSEAIITDFKALPAGATLAEALGLLMHTAQHDFPVVDPAGQVCGVLTRQDLITALGSTGPATPVAEVMHRGIPTVPENASFEEAFATMQSSNCPALPVVDRRGRLVGLITPDNIGEMMMVNSVLAKGGRPAWRTLQSATATEL